jgi:threonine synthase
MDKPSPYFSNLKCRECGKLYPKQAIHVCDFDFGPLEAAYDYTAIGHALTREVIESRPQSMWRYRELLPIDSEPTVGCQVGFTPLVRRIASRRSSDPRALHQERHRKLSHPLVQRPRRLSRLSRARELGFKVVACASTGNLANSVAANAASAGLKSYVLIPADLEQGKVLGL